MNNNDHHAPGVRNYAWVFNAGIELVKCKYCTFPLIGLEVAFACPHYLSHLKILNGMRYRLLTCQISRYLPWPLFDDVC